MRAADAQVSAGPRDAIGVSAFTANCMNGEVRFTLNTSRSSGCFRCIMGVCK
jgi:hypothetical protein